MGADRIGADAVVAAAGAWTAGVCAPPGLRVPAGPPRGQIVPARRPGTGTAAWPAVLPGPDRYQVAFPAGRIVAGATGDHAWFRLPRHRGRGRRPAGRRCRAGTGPAPRRIAGNPHRLPPRHQRRPPPARPARRRPDRRDRVWPPRTDRRPTDRPGRRAAHPRPAAGHRPDTTPPVPIPRPTQHPRAITGAAHDQPANRAAPRNRERPPSQPTAKPAKHWHPQLCAHQAARRQYGSHHQQQLRMILAEKVPHNYAARSATS